MNYTARLVRGQQSEAIYKVNLKAMMRAISQELRYTIYSIYT